MKKSKIQIRRAGLKERLHFLFTGEIPGYWQKANNDVRMNYPEDDEFPTEPYSDSDNILADAEDASGEISLDELPF